MADPKPTEAAWICGVCRRLFEVPSTVSAEDVIEAHRLVCSPLQPRKVVLA